MVRAWWGVAGTDPPTDPARIGLKLLREWEGVAMALGKRPAVMVAESRQAQAEAVTAAAVALVSNPGIWDAVLLLAGLLDVETAAERWEVVEALQVTRELEAQAGRLTAQLDTLDAAARGWALLNAGGSLLNVAG
jgi:hypothetical protein